VDPGGALPRRSDPSRTLNQPKQRTTAQPVPVLLRSALPRKLTPDPNRTQLRQHAKYEEHRPAFRPACQSRHRASEVAGCGGVREKEFRPRRASQAGFKPSALANVSCRVSREEHGRPASPDCDAADAGSTLRASRRLRSACSLALRRVPSRNLGQGVWIREWASSASRVSASSRLAGLCPVCLHWQPLRRAPQAVPCTSGCAGKLACGRIVSEEVLTNTR
jgi:hypothetical protein